MFSMSGLFLVVSVALNKATLLSQALFIIACGLVLVILPQAILQFIESKELA